MFGDFTEKVFENYSPEVFEGEEGREEEELKAQSQEGISPEKSRNTEFVSLCHETYEAMASYIRRLTELMTFELTDSEISKVEISTMQVAKNYRTKIDGLNKYNEDAMLDMNMHTKLYNKMLIIRLTLEADWIAKTIVELKKTQDSVTVSRNINANNSIFSNSPRRNAGASIDSVTNTKVSKEWNVRGDDSGQTSQLFMTMQKMDSLDQALKTTKEIAQMGEMIAIEIERQSEVIDHVYELAKEAETDIEAGNVHLAEANKRIGKSTRMMLILILICTLSVILAGWR